MNTSEYPVWLAVQPEEREQMRSAAGKLNDGRSAVAYSKEDKLWFARPGCDLDLVKEWLPDRSMRAGGGDPEAAFLDVLTQGGLVIKGMPVMDGKRRSVATIENKNGKKSGVYAGYLDRRPGGWYINYQKSDGVVKWSSVGGEADPVARLHIRAAAKQSQEDYARQRAADYARQTRIATRLYNRLPPADPAHPYLVRKGITPTPEIRQTRNGALVVPFFSVQGDFKTLQYIPGTGDKRLFKGGPKKEHFLVVGGPLVPGQPICYAEGYATARSINLATGRPVVMTIDAGNMVDVAQILHQKYPSSPHLFMADFDHAKEENKGLIMATRAAEAVGGHVAYPVFNESEIAQGFTDFNDLHQSRGLDALRGHIDSLFPSYAQSAEVTIMQEQPSLDPQEKPSVLTPAVPAETQASTAADAPAMDALSVAMNIPQNSDQEMMWAASVASRILKTVRDSGFSPQLLPVAEVALKRNFSDALGPFINNASDGKVSVDIPVRWTGETEITGYVTQDGVLSPAGEQSPDFLSVYAKDHDGTSVWVADFNSQARADEFVSKLQAIDTNARSLDKADSVQLSAEPERAVPIVDSAESVDKAQQSPSQDALARQIQNLEAEEAQILVNLKGYYDNYDSEGATIYEAESGLDKLQERLKDLREQTSLGPTLDVTTDASAVVSNVPLQTDAQPDPVSAPEIENSVESNVEPANAEPSEPVNPSPAQTESFVSTQAVDEVVTALPAAKSQVTESSLKTAANDSVDVSMSEPLNVPPPLGTADPDADASATMKPEDLESLIPRRARVEAVSAEPVLDAINVGPRIGQDEPPLEPSTIDKDLLLTRITTETQNDQSVLYKLDNEPAFVDRGTRLEMAPGAGQSDEKIVAALITAARFYRGQIELTGSDAFKAKAIELIAHQRINVSMKNPAQQLMLAQARQALNVSADKPDAIHGETPAPFDPAPPVSTAKEVPVNARPTQSRSQTTAGQKTEPGSVPDFANAGYTPMDVSSMAASEQQSAPINSAAGASRASSAPDIDPAVHTQSKIAEQPVTGKIMDYGTKPFRFDPQNTESVYITMRTKSGTQTFWGKELAGLLRDTRIQKGRMATLQWLGQYPVTVKVPIKDQETGKVLRFADKEAVRNQWSLSLLNGPTVRTDDDQGVKLMAYDAARFSMIQHSIIAQLNVPIELPHHPSDGLFWMTPNGQGSAKAGDELSAPRPAVDSKSAGSPVISSWSQDGQLDMALFRGDGPYLQGVVRQGDQYQHVLVSLPGTEGEPPMVINQITNHGLVPIGVGNAINSSGGEPVAREHIAFKLEGDTDVRIAKLDFPSEMPPALHHRLGFDERWKDTNNLPKSSPAAAPTAQPNVARPY
ncbi:LPD7 domain-containing protein [Pseudomonas viridiflava]|uniref:LPD7 domain-containing protein n=1 Tax=Pseudomonas viridiflava TaxID=33069 RepID=UPI000F046511|nr:LPD7 domain-containing protein [Pseudomonas viridiflava]